ELLVVGRDQPAVSKTEEVLRRIEAEGRDLAVARDPLGAERLGRVLEHVDAELDEGPDVHRAAEEVDGDDRLRPVGDLRGRVLDDLAERGFELGKQRPVLGAYVNERDRLHYGQL